MNALPQNRFHTLAAALIAAIIDAGFARTYYFAFLIGAPPLTWLMHLHGLTFTAWLVLHFVQARLIAKHRYDLHRYFGAAGAFIGLGMIVLGAIAWHGALVRGRAPNGRDPFAFSAVSAITLLEFALFLGTALWMRRNREWHKRLMLLASISIIGPPLARISRWPVFGGYEDARIPFAGLVILISALAVYDLVRSRRIHPATAIAGVICVASTAAASIFATSGVAQTLVHSLR